MPKSKCNSKVRFNTERKAKAAIRHKIKGGDVTAIHLRAYPCEKHGCFHIGNNSTPLKFMLGASRT